jgi:hypothetical protein
VSGKYRVTVFFKFLHGSQIRRKSQLAIEYSYQVRSQSPATWVFWVHASNEARFKQSFRDIADRIKIADRQDPKIYIFNLVENWLRDESRGRWLLILDNVDNDQLLSSLSVAGKKDPISSQVNASTKPLSEYIPRSRNGSVIITSRARDITLKMVHHKDLIKIEPIQEFEALELLQKKLDQPRESEEGQQLVNALELIPLAIIDPEFFVTTRNDAIKWIKDVVCNLELAHVQLLLTDDLNPSFYAIFPL